MEEIFKKEKELQQIEFEMEIYEEDLQGKKI